MRYLVFIITLFAALQTNAQNNIVYGAGINYTNGAPTFTPPVRTSRVAIDTVTGRWYHFNTPGGWQLIGNTIEEIAGCTAPAYTPGKGDSKVVINNCSPQPELYFYNGSAWVLVGGGSVYAGEGIRIENDTIILDSLYILRFRTGSNTDGAAGAMSWNATEETVDLVTDQGAVTGHLMESAYYNTRNTTGSSIVVGTVVMANGTTGNTGRILIAPAIANGTVNSEYILGLAAQTIGNNSNGKVQHFGKIRGIQTNGANYGETWVDGDVLYCSSATPGYLTKVLPTAPNLKVPIAIVIHAHPSNGTLFVRPSHFPDLAQINDVQLSSPTNGQVLTYNSTLSRWENTTPANQLQTLSTDGSAGNISISSGNTITLNVNDADASATNELQTLSVAANTATLSNSGGSVTIAGAGINTVGTAGTTITVTGTEVDGSTTNELQTLSTGTNTLTLSNGGGTVTVDTNPADDVTGSGAAGQVSFWTGTQTQSGDNGLFWDNANKRLAVGLTGPSARLHVVGSGTSSSTWTAQFHNSAGNNNALMIRDDGNVGIGTNAPGARLQINGSGLTSSTSSLRLVDNNTNQYFNAADDGQLTLGKNVTLSTASTYRVFQGNPTLTNTVSGGLSQDVAFFSGGLTYAGSEPFFGARAMQFSANNRNTATSNQIWGAYFVAQNETTTARASQIRGMDMLLINNATGGTIGEVSGFTVRVPIHAVGSTITNTIGINILDLTPTTAGTQTNVYSIYSSDINARMYHAGQVGIGTTSPNTSAAFEVASTTQGILFPRMTTAQRDLIATPANGLVIYNSTTDKLQVRAAGAWVDLH